MYSPETTATRLLTVAEAAAELRISTATAYRLVAADKLPAVRVGGSIRIVARELHALLETTSPKEDR